MIQNMEYLKKIEHELKSARVLSPRVEAEMLVTHFGRLSRLEFFTGEKSVGISAKRSIEKALKIRKSGHPLFYLTGEAPFYGRMFKVTKDTLIPRPETELLVEEALSILLKHYGGQEPQILDVGTGSGCIAASLTLEWPPCRMTALDASTPALKVARKNVDSLGLDGKIQLIQSQLFDKFGPAQYGFWDMIVSNPPYVPREDWPALSREVRSEPKMALDGGPGGLKIVEKLLDEAPIFLKPRGWMLLEIGKGQSKRLRNLLKNNSGYSYFEFVKDLNGIERILVAQKQK